MTLAEIAQLLSCTLDIQIHFVTTFDPKETQVLIQTDEGALVSDVEAFHLMPLIEKLMDNERTPTTNPFEQWLNFLNGKEKDMPQTLNLKADTKYRLLKLYPVSKPLQNELQSTFLALLDAEIIYSAPRSALWLIKSDNSVRETIHAFSETLSTEYDSSIRLILSNYFLGEQANYLLPSTYSVLLSLEKLLNDEDAHSPVIFEEHMTNLLFNEWRHKHMSVVERLVRESASLNQIDEETHKTIETLFRMNLNLTDTAKALFIHRNTLIYRLDKVEKSLGYDLRHFEDAFALKLMLRLKI